MTYLFSKKKDDQLIELVRTNPILYDPYHDNFRNLIMKHQVWENISSTLGIPLLDVKKRWRHFRDHYVKKLKLAESRRTRGKPWEHMKRLQFLALSRPRREAGEPAAASDDDRVVYVMQPPCSSDDEEPAIKRRRRSSSEASATSVAAEPLEPVEPAAADTDDAPRPESRVPEPARDAIYKFFESMAAIVAQFPPRRAAEARLRVCQLITEMEIEAHTDRLEDRDLPVKLEQ